MGPQHLHDRRQLLVPHHQHQRKGQRPHVVVEQQREGVEVQLLAQLAHDDDVRSRGHGGGEREHVAGQVEGEVAHARDEAPRRGHEDGQLDGQRCELAAEEVVEQQHEGRGGALEHAVHGDVDAAEGRHVQEELEEEGEGEEEDLEG